MGNMSWTSTSESYNTIIGQHVKSLKDRQQKPCREVGRIAGLIFFKIFFIYKYIKVIFFNFLKIIFNINTFK
jgi:hypothetical protein